MLTLRVNTQSQHVSKGLDLYLRVNIAFQKVEQVVMEVVLDVVVGNEDPVIKTTSEMHVAPQISKAASGWRC